MINARVEREKQEDKNMDEMTFVMAVYLTITQITFLFNYVSNWVQKSALFLVGQIMNLIKGFIFFIIEFAFDIVNFGFNVVKVCFTYPFLLVYSILIDGRKR